MSKELKLIEALIDVLGYEVKTELGESFRVGTKLNEHGGIIKFRETCTDINYKLIKKEMIGWSCVNNNPPPVDEEIVIVDDGDIYWRACLLKYGGYMCAQGHMMTPSHWMSISDATKMLGIITNE